MKKTLILFSSLIICGLVFSQKNPDAVLMTLENEQITVKEFEYIFKKNSTDEKVTKASLDEYIELFVNYKLKVLAAKDAKLDTNKAFISELAGYRKQLARPYLTDGELLDQLTKEAYERKKKEIHARHILIRVDADADPLDSLAAWNKIKSLKDRIEGGEDFETVAKGKGGSEDPSVRDNGGDLGFFSAFQMVYPFEEAAYTTKVGQVSPIIRTRYGYHILEVLEEREARGQIKVAHIMTKSPANATADNQARAKEKINEIHSKYVNGESFEDLARMYSEDGTTSKTGGELPWFGTRKMVKSFEDVSFKLENIGDVSQPFQTEYGWHIVKKLDEKVIGDYDQLKAEIKSKVSKDSRADVTRQSFLNKLKKDYSVSAKDKKLKYFHKSIDTTFFTKEWEMNYPKKLSKPFMKIESQVFTIGDFNKFLIKQKRRAKTDDATSFINESYDRWKNDALFEYEDSQLENKHEPFRLLMNEYRDGILLFELTDELVWSKAIKDTTGLREYYEKNKSNYLWSERFQSEIYTVKDIKVGQQIVELIQGGMTKDSIVDIVNAETALNVSIENGIYSEEEKMVLSKTSKEKGKVEIIEFEGKIYVINIINVLPESPKKLDETKGLVTSDYQNHLEKIWLESLRSKYTFSVNQDVLYSIADE